MEGRKHPSIKPFFSRLNISFILKYKILIYTVFILIANVPSVSELYNTKVTGLEIPISYIIGLITFFVMLFLWAFSIVISCLPPIMGVILGTHFILWIFRVVEARKLETGVYSGHSWFSFQSPRRTKRVLMWSLYLGSWSGPSI